MHLIGSKKPCRTMVFSLHFSSSFFRVCLTCPMGLKSFHLSVISLFLLESNIFCSFNLIFGFWRPNSVRILMSDKHSQPCRRSSLCRPCPLSVLVFSFFLISFFFSFFLYKIYLIELISNL